MVVCCVCELRTNVGNRLPEAFTEREWSPNTDLAVSLLVSQNINKSEHRNHREWIGMLRTVRGDVKYVWPEDRHQKPGEVSFWAALCAMYTFLSG